MSSAAVLQPPFWLRALLLAALCLATRAAAVEPLRVVATGGRIGYTFYTPTTGNTAFRHRTPHVLGGPVAEIQIGFMDWMYTDKVETANATNDVTISHAWLERAVTGQVVPLTFSGSRQLILPMDSTTPVWLADAIPSSAWTGAALARDEIFWVHVRGSVPEGGKLPVGTPSTYSGARFAAYPPANDPGTFDTAGPVATITGWSTRTEGLPLVFLGRYTGPGHLAVIGIGDSILHGSGDAANPTAAIAGYGFFNRAALDSAGKNAIATFNLTRHGQTASAWVKTTSQSRQTPFLQYANVVVEEYGTNDLGQAGGGDPAVILANVEKIWAAARAAGVQKIVRTLLMPRATSTDAWVTVENQTPLPGWGLGEKRDTINAGLLAARTAGKVDAVLDTLAVLGAPGDSSRWRINGVANYLTKDSTHLQPAANAELAPHLRALLLSLAIDDYGAWTRAVSWNGADSAPGADPDHDGRANLLEYALGADPLYPSSNDNVRITNIEPALALTFPRLRHDLTYVVQGSSDLVAWDAIASNPGAVGETVTVTDPVPLSEASRRFLRLQVTR